ncbi:hypothetical protein CRM22_003014 [Opisthorchis felineus]|uniref:Ig-like domain-containing protein n=1 Tax=Opisthorchis felineus TaxID=147828 RepID=A0A4S2M9H9_OPIFE|nr:hypothetical protein CRM22_003014 [Opisthorchis felineus]
MLARFVAYVGLLICSVSLSTLAQHVYLEPKSEIIAQDRYEFIQICILYKKMRLCSITDKQAFADASCNASKFGSDSRLNLTYAFTHKLATQTLTPGVYIFTCKAGPDSHAVVSRRLLIERYAPRLDCSARSQFIRIKPKHSLFPICCLRIPTRADWIRDLKRPIDWCLDHLTCVSPYNRTRFDRGTLYFPELSDIMSGAITIRCNDAEYEEEHYLLGPGTSDLMIHVHPNHSVLFVEQHKYLAFCVGFPNKPDCFDHRPGISPTLCTAHQKNVTISFRSRLQLTTEVSEGAYDIKCHHQQTFLNKSTTILVLHNGSFVWDCSVAPRIIYLESKLNSYVICRWKMNVTDKWKPFLNRLPHKYPSIYCRDNMRSLRFDGGVLLVNHSQRIQGVFRIFCHEKLVIEDLIITDRFSDLRLSIYPELTAIDKSVSGTLQARLEWRGATRHNVFQLRERFPVNCSYFTMKNDSHSTRYFTDPIRFAELPQGELHVKCTCSALKLTNQLVKFVFSSPVWQRISHSDDSKGSLNLTPYRAVSQLLGCLKPAGRLSFVGTVLQLRLTQLSPTELTTLCPGYEHNVTVYFNAPDISIIVRPEQDFYLLNQEQPVRLRLSVKDETTQYAEILGSVRLNCTVYDTEGEQVELTTKASEATTVYSYVSFAPRNKPYKSGVYGYKCGAISKTLKLEKALTIVDPKEVTLIIKNRGKQIHYTGEVHSYICILEGPPVDAIRSERHEPRWISRESSRSAVVWKNVLHIAEEASVGHYHYQCLYNKNGLKLENGLRFSVFDKDLMTLDIDPLGDSTFVYHTRGIRPAFRCHTKYLDTNILHRPVWRLLHGQSDFVIKDETDYTQSQSAVYLVDDKEGQSTFQCSLRVKEKCLSRLLIFWRFSGIVKPNLQPLLREYPTGSSVQCVSRQQSVLHSLVEMTVVSDNLGRVTADRSSVVWFINDRSYRVGEAYLTCHLRATYLNEMYGKVWLVIPVRVLATERLFVSPNPVIDQQEIVSCKTFSPISEKFSPVLIIPHRMDREMLTREDTSVYEVNNQMQSGGHIYHCILFLPERSPQVLEDRISVLHLPQTTVLEEVTDNGEVIGWSCVTDGYPKEASTYQITILEQPRNDRMTAKHKALFQIHPKQVFYTMVLVSITFHFGIYVYFLRRTLKDRKADQVPVNFAMLDDVTLNIHEVNLGWTDFGHLCSLVREFSIINKMCLIFAESDRQSPVSSSPTDIQPAEVGQDHSLTNSDSISTDSDIKGLYQDELPTLHDALMKYHDNRDRRSILLAGEHPLIRFSMMINEPLTNQVDEPVPHSSSSQTERRQNE